MSTKKNGKILEKNIFENLILTSIFLITLTVNPNVPDPINIPKIQILYFFTLLIFINQLVLNKLALPSKSLLNFLILILILSNFISALISQNKFKAFFGESSRMTGFNTFICLVVIFIAVKNHVRIHNLNKFNLVVIFTSFLLIMYGYLQFTNNDFIPWDNQYNRIILTLGNPNFSGAVMAILSVFLLGITIQTDLSKGIRLISLIEVLNFYFLIYASNARQGIISALIGLVVIIIGLTYRQSKKLALTILLIVGSVLVLLIAGMLQVGPLRNLIYKESISLRGFYWRAGIKMFQDNFFFGVGPDQYQDYFRLYREASYPLKYGNAITSSHSHNVIINNFATGGIFFGLTYLILIFITLHRVLSRFKYLNDNEFRITLGIFGSWLAYVSQSIVSIDNVGISIWGNLLLGLLWSDSTKVPQVLSVSSRRKTEDARRVIVGIYTIIFVTLLVLFNRTELNVSRALMFYNSGLTTQFYELAQSELTSKFLIPENRVTLVNNIINAGYIDTGANELRKLAKKYPRDLEILNNLALVEARLGNIKNSIKIREEIAKLDPWNTSNYLDLIKLFLIEKDTNNATKYYSFLNGFAPNALDTKNAFEILDQNFGFEQ